MFMNFFPVSICLNDISLVEIKNNKNNVFHFVDEAMNKLKENQCKH